MALGIQSNVSALNANYNYLRASNKTNQALAKLSSGLRINQGRDDPAGLIISELLRSQIGGYQRAVQNTQEASNVMAIAEGGLQSVSSMLQNMRGLAIHALNSGVTSDAQVQADQGQLNSALSTINRVVSTTNFAGRNLLDGSSAFTFGTDDPGGLVNAAQTAITGMSGTSGNSAQVEFSGGAGVQAERAYLEAGFGGPSTQTAQDFTVAGNAGSRTFSFAAGTTVEDMAAAINSSAESTGVNAYAVRDQGSGATALRLASSEYGSGQSVQVTQNEGAAFGVQGQTVRDAGQDATVSVNGGDVVTNGLVATVDAGAGGFNGKIAFNAGSPGAATIAQTGYDQDTLTDATGEQGAALTDIRGGMQLQLGDGSGGQNRERVSLGSYNGATLGQVTVDGETYSLNDLYGGGAASLANDPALALKVIDQAISDVSSGRGSIGAYQANALQTNVDNLMVGMENLTATESSIRDTDMASAITDMVRARLMQQAGVRNILSANMNSQNVLRLLGM